DLLGIPIPNEVQGVSLVDAMNSDESALDRPLYAETLAPRLGFGWGELRALIDGKDKYIFGPRPELFDIRADPRELDNRLAGEAELGDRMQRRLAAFLRENAADNLDAAVSMDEETRQKLQALGYLGSGAGADEPIEEVLRQGGIPPQDTVTYINDISQVKIKIFRHQSLVALEILETLLDNDPENPSYLEMSVTANVQLGRLDEALAIIERARALDATSVATSTILLQLGSLYFYQGDLDKAEPLLRQSLDLEPLALGHYLLASVYTARGDLAAERAALEAALDADPSYAPARVDLAIRYAQAGDRERAARELDRALRDQPYFAKGYYNYGAFLVEGGDLDGALSQFERAVELDPNYWLGYLALVELSLALDKPTDAKQHYQTLLRRAPNRDETAQARERIEGIS
ncbi:MAG: tetratricopeptide repeat protein, partial [Acidobacteriota bacterium]